MADQIAKPKNPADDWKIWLVINPSTWLITIFVTVLFVAVEVHNWVFSLPGFGWH